MSDKLSVSLDVRTVVGKQVNRLRREGILPATVYGKGVGPFSVQINAREFNDLYRKAGRTKAIEINIPGQPIQTAFIHSVQRNPVSRAIVHADFLAVDAKTELVIEVPVHMVGESPLARQGLAVVNLVLATVAVRALPSDVPSHVEADVSVLDSLDKNIHARDLKVPGNASVVGDLEEVVVSITPSRDEEAAEAAAPAEPELVRKARTDE